MSRKSRSLSIRKSGQEWQYPRSWPPQEFFVHPREVPAAQLAALQRLIVRGSSEREVDAYIRRHPAVLAACLNFGMTGHHGTWAVPQAQIRPPLLPASVGLRPDYLVGGLSSDGYAWYVVELKGVRERLFSGEDHALRFSSAANRGIVQLLSYLAYCSETQAFLRDTMGLRGFNEPKGILVLGQKGEFETSPARQRLKAAANRHFGGRVQLRTYDALLGHYNLGLTLEPDLQGAP